MKNKKNVLVVVLAVVLVAVAAVILFEERVQAPVAGNDAGTGAGAEIAGAAPDNIVVVPATGSAQDGDQVIENKTTGYFVTIPADWYVEKSAGAGLAVYPDYDPAGGAAPTCKVEVAAFSDADAAGSGLDAWITAHLHNDPTADVIEDARRDIAIGGNNAGAGAETDASAIEWTGSLNGVSTTLAYAAGDDPDGNGEILEFAASSLAEPDGTGNGDCGLMVEPLVANLQFGNYTP